MRRCKCDLCFEKRMWLGTEKKIMIETIQNLNHNELERFAIEKGFVENENEKEILKFPQVEQINLLKKQVNKQKNEISNLKMDNITLLKIITDLSALLQDKENFSKNII